MSIRSIFERRGRRAEPTFENPYIVDSDGFVSDEIVEINVPFHKNTTARKFSLEQLYDQAQSYRGEKEPETQYYQQSPARTLEQRQMQIDIPTRINSQPQEEKTSLYQRRLSRRDSQERPQTAMSSSIQSPISDNSRSGSPNSYHTNATSYSLPALQQRGAGDHLDPLAEEDIDPDSFDLVVPGSAEDKQYSLEKRSEQLFSTEHLKVIFNDPSLLLRFTAFLSSSRPTSIPILIYYLDSVKALKAIKYSNAIAEALDPIDGFEFTQNTVKNTANAQLEEKSRLAFEAMVREDLPAYITHTYIQTVSLSIQRRITDKLPSHLREASEGLAEVFCLTDPSRPDNPIVFASEEFHRTTQYGMSYVLGRNCRFLQGPKTSPFSVNRLREKIKEGKEHCEVFLNYRRDGSPFMNLLMCAPLTDSRGVVRYFIGAQVDVSGLVKECSDLESLRELVKNQQQQQEEPSTDPQTKNSKNEKLQMQPLKDEFQELSEMLNLQELNTVRKWGGRMHKESHEEIDDPGLKNSNWNKPRLVISSLSPDGVKGRGLPDGRLAGIYQHYLLVRPYPNLRILFASPTLRVPGILQSPLMNRIGGSPRVREELTRALADGRGVTAKVKWVAKGIPEGRSRWMHCTPLIGSNGAIGVWMIVLVDDEDKLGNRFRLAPPVDPNFGRRTPINGRDDASLAGDGIHTARSGSPYTVKIDD